MLYKNGMPNLLSCQQHWNAIMKNFTPFIINEEIILHIPDTWKATDGEFGEYAFKNERIHLTASFIKVPKSQQIGVREMLEEATAGLKNWADFFSPIRQHDHYATRYIMIQDQITLIAILGKTNYKEQILANLFFRTDGQAVFDENRELMEQIIAALEIKS